MENDYHTDTHDISSKRKKYFKPGKTALVRWGTVALLLLCAVFTLYVWYLDVTIRKQFEGKRWAIPARVYARSLELYAGLHIDMAQLEKELLLAGYLKKEQPSFPGSFALQNNTIHLATRPFDFGDSFEPARNMEIRFAGSRVVDIRAHDSGLPLDIVRLEPVKIGSFHPLRHEDRILVNREEIPHMLIMALLAVEDRKFYEHGGIDPRGIGRALWVNIRAGATVQGGSTLTQQLVKNFFLHNKRTVWRKLTEAIMALLLESHYGKDEILTAYVNEVFLGQDGNRAIHGFGLASHFYFRRDLEELNLGQISLLVGMVKGPSYYDPRTHAERSIKRRRIVLEAMRSQGSISEAQLHDADLVSIEETRHAVSGINRFPAFLDLVRRHLRRDYREEDLTSEGLKIFTTLDPRVQWQLEEALATTLPGLEKETGQKDIQAAAVISDRSNGEIQAIVGDRTGRYKGFNRALDAVRPIGSLIKPAVYLAALENGYTLASLVEDTPLTIANHDGSEWIPQNFDKTFHGPVPLHQALANSYNIATIKLGMAVGFENVHNTLKRLGVTKDFPPYPAVLLGAAGLSPIEVCQLYQTLAGGGFYSPLRAIRKVLNGDNQVLQRYPLSVEQRVDPAPVFLINTVLQEVVSHGTAASLSAYLPATHKVAGKTGTSDNFRDSWYAGFTGDRLGVVWLGKDDNTPLQLTGAGGALKVWGKLMQSLPPQPLELVEPPGVEWAWVDSLRHIKVSRHHNNAEYLPFVQGTVPPSTSKANGTKEETKKTSTGGGWLKKFFDWVF